MFHHSHDGRGFCCCPSVSETVHGGRRYRRWPSLQGGRQRRRGTPQGRRSGGAVTDGRDGAPQGDEGSPPRLRLGAFVVVPIPSRDGVRSPAIGLAHGKLGRAQEIVGIGPTAAVVERNDFTQVVEMGVLHSPRDFDHIANVFDEGIVDHLDSVRLY